MIESRFWACCGMPVKTESHVLTGTTGLMVICGDHADGCNRVPMPQRDSSRKDRGEGRGIARVMPQDCESSLI